MNQTSNVIRFPELREKLGKIGRSTIFRWERDGKFPKHISLGANSVGWIESQVDAWIDSRIKQAQSIKNNDRTTS